MTRASSGQRPDAVLAAEALRCMGDVQARGEVATRLAGEAA